MTSLSIFYKNGDEVIIKYLVEFVQISVKQIILLFSSFKSKKEALAKYIVEYGEDINNKNGEILIFFSCKNGNDAMIKHFVKRGTVGNKGLIPLFKTNFSEDNVNIFF